MTIPQSINQFQYSDSINRRTWDNQYVFQNFTSNPSVSKLAGGASSGTTGAVNIMNFNNTSFEYQIKGSGETITAPSIASISQGISGLNPELDLTNDEGIEICAGILANNPSAFQTATSSPFFFRARVLITDPTLTDNCAFGFRKAEAYQADINDYTNMAVLNIITGDIKIQTILNNASTVNTDTTDNWTAGATNDIEIDVDQDGAVTYMINQQEPTVTAAYSFPEDTTVVPFFYFLHNSTNTDVITFDIDFVSLNSIVATVNSVALDPVVFTTDQATTIALVAAAIAAVPAVASATVTDTREITVVFNPGGSNVVNSVITTLGATQPVGTIVATANNTVGLRILEWECGLQ